MTVIELSIKMSKTAPAKTCTFYTDRRKCCRPICQKKKNEDLTQRPTNSHYGYYTMIATNSTSLLCPHSGGQCHLIHLTILRRFSCTSLAYICSQRWPKSRFISFHFYALGALCSLTELITFLFAKNNVNYAQYALVPYKDRNNLGWL